MLGARAFGARQLVNLGGDDAERNLKRCQPVVGAHVALEARVPAIDEQQGPERGRWAVTLSGGRLSGRAMPEIVACQRLKGVGRH